MKTRFLLSFLLSLLFLGACQKYDDSQIKADISSLQSRVSALESLCSQMNSNIANLQSIVSALQNNYYVSGVTPLENGYKISFTNGNSISIYNGKDGVDGKDGKDGTSPVISVKQGEDGVWYWTLNGEWLLDANGARIPTTGEDGKDGADGKDGKDGITPQLKIQDEYWYISVDNGATWTKLDKATGEDGDTLFSSVTDDDDYVYLNLTDGSVFKLPKEPQLSLSFEKTEYHPSSSSMDIPFTLKGADDDARVYAFCESTLSVEVSLDNYKEGMLKVTFLTEDCTGNILVVAKSGSNKVVEVLEFEKAELSTSSAKEFSVGYIGGDFMISVSHNVDLKVESDSDWITMNATKTVVTEDLSFHVSKNDGTSSRTGVITVRSCEDTTSLKFTVTQSGKISSLKLSRNTFMGMPGKYYPISVVTTPEDASCDIEWSSSYDYLASVSGSGKDAVIGVYNEDFTQSSTITARDRISGLTASIKVYTMVSDFTWTENTGKTYASYPLITIAVGEQYQLNYTCSPYRMDNIFENHSNLVFYEPTAVVEEPSNISISNDGVVTGLKTGTTGIKPTGAIMKKSDGTYRVYIKVVDCYEEEEPNNDFPYATVMRSGMPMKFYISTTTDVDVLKFTNPVTTSGNDMFKISVKYNGDGSSVVKALRWELYNSSCTLFGSGSLLFDASGNTIELSKWLNTTTGYLKFYFPTNHYNYPEMRPTGSLEVSVSK